MTERKTPSKDKSAPKAKTAPKTKSLSKAKTLPKADPLARQLSAEDRLAAADALIKLAAQVHPDQQPLIAQQALDLSQDCVFAHLLLAADTYEDFEISQNHHINAIEAAHRIHEMGTKKKGLAKAVVEENVAMFNISSQKLASFYLDYNYPEKALKLLSGLIKLDPDDSYGARCTMAIVLYELGLFDELHQLFDRFKNDSTASLAYTQALDVYRRSGDCPEAIKALQYAFKCNPHVPMYFDQQEDPEKNIYGSNGPGTEFEAERYRDEGWTIWQETPGALEWLKENWKDKTAPRAKTGSKDKTAPKTKSKSKAKTPPKANTSARELSPEDRLAAAESLIYHAAQTKGKQQVKLAKEALALSQDCVFAHIMLADAVEEEYEPSTQHRLDALAAAERLAGPDWETVYRDRYWEVKNTRMLMMAMESLASHYQDFGMPEKSVGLFRRLHELDPLDRQGNRWPLASTLYATQQFDELQALLNRYKNDTGAGITYTRALDAFRRLGDGLPARKTLLDAFKYNKYVPLNLADIYDDRYETPLHFELGGDEEAFKYTNDSFGIWFNTPGALKWMADVLEPELKAAHKDAELVAAALEGLRLDGP